MDVYEKRIAQEERDELKYRSRRGVHDFHGKSKREECQTLRAAVTRDQHGLMGKCTQGHFALDEPRPYRHRFRDGHAGGPPPGGSGGGRSRLVAAEEAKHAPTPFRFQVIDLRHVASGSYRLLNHYDVTARRSSASRRCP
jgi:hypothetical protein